MKKILSSLVLSLVLILAFYSTAFACYPSYNSISVISQDQGTVTFNVTVDNITWVEFGDGLGTSLQKGTGQICHRYQNDKTYYVTMYQDKLPIAQTKVIVKEQSCQQNKSSFYLINNDFNSLTVGINCSSKTKLDWGDGTSVVVKGINQSVSHDYAYNVNSWKSYNLTLGSQLVGTFTIYDGSTKNSILITNTCYSITTTEIINWSDNNIYICPQTTQTIEINSWKTGNFVILPLETVIKTGPAKSYKTAITVTNSHWIAKIIEGPRYSSGIWWKIELAGGKTGWILQSDNSFIFN
ncbi:MAG: hypothetical protein PHN66_03835 [Candidatus Shapirobacteria bacterium]|nr:hypothetical protein [Candidatus Shapirobacteria bacterium]